MKSQISMAARKATKVNKNERKGLDNSNEIKEENIQSSYFKDCNSGISIQPRKKPRLKPEKKEEPVSLTQLGRTFYDKPTESLAKELLGKLLYRVLDDGEVLCGRIVETEGYLGEVDKACHSFGGKKTARTEPVYMAPGTAYVYIIYGMYHCLNISSHESGACVLIRALEPLQGFEPKTSMNGFYLGDLITHPGDQEIHSVSGGLLDNPGEQELAYISASSSL